jgi:hypothetical protein
MFKILPSTYFWPITAHVAEDGKVVEKVLFEAEFKRLGQKEFEEIKKLPVLDQVKAVVLGWRNAKDVEGNDVPFTPETFNDLLNQLPDSLGLFVEAFLESQSLIKRKN